MLMYVPPIVCDPLPFNVTVFVPVSGVAPGLLFVQLPVKEIAFEPAARIPLLRVIFPPTA